MHILHVINNSYQMVYLSDISCNKKSDAFRSESQALYSYTWLIYNENIKKYLFLLTKHKYIVRKWIFVSFQKVAQRAHFSPAGAKIARAVDFRTSFWPPKKLRWPFYVVSPTLGIILGPLSQKKNFHFLPTRGSTHVLLFSNQLRVKL